MNYPGDLLQTMWSKLITNVCLIYCICGSLLYMHDFLVYTCFFIVYMIFLCIRDFLMYTVHDFLLYTFFSRLLFLHVFVQMMEPDPKKRWGAQESLAHLESFRDAFNEPGEGIERYTSIKHIKHMKNRHQTHQIYV